MKFKKYILIIAMLYSFFMYANFSFASIIEIDSLYYSLSDSVGILPDRIYENLIGDKSAMTIIIGFPYDGVYIDEPGGTTWPYLKNPDSPYPNFDYPNEPYPILGAFPDGTPLRDYLGEDGSLAIDSWYGAAYEAFFTLSSGGKMTMTNTFSQKNDGNPYQTDKTLVEWVSDYGEYNLCWRKWNEMANEVAVKIITDDPNAFDNIDIVNLTFDVLPGPKKLFHNEHNGTVKYGELKNPETDEIIWPTDGTTGKFTLNRNCSTAQHESMHALASMPDRGPDRIVGGGHYNMTTTYDHMCHNEVLVAMRSLYGVQPIISHDLAKFGWITEDETNLIAMDENVSEIKLVDMNGDLTLQQQQEGYRKLAKIMIRENFSGERDEYFLIDFHNGTNFDMNLYNEVEGPYNSGLLIWHIKEKSFGSGTGDDYIDLELAQPYNGYYGVSHPNDDYPLDYNYKFKIDNNNLRPPNPSTGNAWNGQEAGDFDWLDDLFTDMDGSDWLPQHIWVTSNTIDKYITPNGGKHYWEETADWESDPTDDDDRPFSRISSLQGDFFTNEVVNDHIADNMTDFTRPSTKKWDGSLSGIAIYDIKRIENNGDPYFTFKVQRNCLTYQTITQNTTWSGDIYIAGDFTVPEGVTLTIAEDCVVNFCGSHEFKVEGTVLNSGEFNLSGRSTLLVDGGLFKLKWGSSFSGRDADVQYTVDMMDRVIQGDRVFVRNEGLFTTPSWGEFTSYYNYTGVEPDSIKIYSAGESKWHGITIETRKESSAYYTRFTNCDIQGINGIRMTNVENIPNSAYMYFYRTNFHNAGEIFVDDDTNLYIYGSQFYNCSRTPIRAYHSKLHMNNTTYGGNTYNNYIGNNSGVYGIDLHYASNYASSIYNTEITDNRYGCYVYNHSVSFNNTDIYENDYFGILAPYDDGIANFDAGSIYNNGAPEIYGRQASLRNLKNGNNYFGDTVNSGYIFMCTDWSVGDDPIDISGNTLSSTSISRYYPSNYDAWIFGAQPSTPKALLLAQGTESMNDEQYPEATATFKEIITDYPESAEAVTAVNLLYFVENFTGDDLEAYRTYLDSIAAPDSTDMAKMIRSMKNKTYIDEKNYYEAITRLEEITIDPNSTDDEITYALIDIAYCNYKLSQQGTQRGMGNCNNHMNALDSFLQEMDYLESQLSFNKEFTKGMPINTLVPKITTLKQNYPNPFNPTTSIDYQLTSTGNVSVQIYDAMGRLVKNLVDEKKDAGYHRIMWNGKDEAGNSVSSGVYFYHLETKDHQETKQMLLLK